MTSDAFRRLAFLAACSSYTLGLVLVAELIALWAVVPVLAGGVVLAFALTVELDRGDPDPVKPRHRPGARDAHGRPAGFVRLDEPRPPGVEP